jgi:hypothetical protein
MHKNCGRTKTTSFLPEPCSGFWGSWAPPKWLRLAKSYRLSNHHSQQPSYLESSYSLYQQYNQTGQKAKRKQQQPAKVTETA